MAGRHSKRGLARARIPEQRGPEPAGHHRAIGITDARTRVEHLVTDEAVAADRRSGCYVGMCGEEVLAASLLTRGLSHCQPCQVANVARVTA